MDLDRYLARIGYDGPVAPDLACLTAVHRQHALSIPYENVDVQLGRRLDFDPTRIFEKLVTRKRGGWCYEMNGLLGAALEAIGFRVTRLAGGVARSTIGDEALGNHLVLRIDLEEPWIADVGLGDGALEPLRLVSGPVEQSGRHYALEALAPGEWRFRNHEGALPPDFDFIEAPDEASLTRSCAQLQDDPTSLFRQNLLVMRPTTAGTHLLFGRVYRAPSGEKHTLADGDALVATLNDVFDIEDDGLPALWPAVAARHAELFDDA